jgi:hypothetical protein
MNDQLRHYLKQVPLLSLLLLAVGTDGAALSFSSAATTAGVRRAVAQQSPPVSHL